MKAICPQCGIAVKAPDVAIGKIGRCPECKHEFKLTASGASPNDSAQAAPPKKEGGIAKALEREAIGQDNYVLAPDPLATAAAASSSPPGQPHAGALPLATRMAPHEIARPPLVAEAIGGAAAGPVMPQPLPPWGAPQPTPAMLRRLKRRHDQIVLVDNRLVKVVTLVVCLVLPVLYFVPWVAHHGEWVTGLGFTWRISVVSAACSVGAAFVGIGTIGAAVSVLLSLSEWRMGRAAVPLTIALIGAIMVLSATASLRPEGRQHGIAISAWDILTAAPMLALVFVSAALVLCLIQVDWRAVGEFFSFMVPPAEPLKHAHAEVSVLPVLATVASLLLVIAWPLSWLGRNDLDALPGAAMTVFVSESMPPNLTGKAKEVAIAAKALGVGSVMYGVGAAISLIAALVALPARSGMKRAAIGIPLAGLGLIVFMIGTFCMEDVSMSWGFYMAATCTLLALGLALVQD